MNPGSISAPSHKPQQILASHMGMPTKRMSGHTSSNGVRTKNPPRIIHSSLGRFTKVMPLEPVRCAASDEHIDFMLHVDHLTLRNQLKVNMLESRVVKVYDL